MKLWIKYLIAIALGLGAAFILPANNTAIASVVASLSEFSVRFGRYTLLPLLFFGVSTAVFQLRSTKLLGKTALWTIIAVFGTTLILALLGLLSILIVKLPRIPITGEKMSSLPAIDIKSLTMQLFPYSGFG